MPLKLLSMSKPKAKTLEQLEAENEQLKQLIRDAASYPYMSVNLYNLLTKGLNEIETRTTQNRD